MRGAGVAAQAWRRRRIGRARLTGLRGELAWYLASPEGECGGLGLNAERGLLGGKAEAGDCPSPGARSPDIGNAGWWGSLSVTSPREWGSPGCGEREGTGGGENLQPEVPA